MSKAFNPFVGSRVYVAYVETAEPVDVGNGETWYFFSAVPPETPGVFDFQSSFDAGDTWNDLAKNVVFTGDIQRDPFFTVWVNPKIAKPYVWYRFVRSATSVGPAPGPQGPPGIAGAV